MSAHGSFAQQGALNRLAQLHNFKLNPQGCKAVCLHKANPTATRHATPHISQLPHIPQELLPETSQQLLHTATKQVN